MSKRVTVKEVASHAGVSYQTVSKVLNKQTKVSKPTEERIWQAVRALGYHPDQRARNLRLRRSHTLGYSWAPSPPDRANSILDLFLQSMMAAAEASGYHLLPFPYRQVDDQIATYRELIGSAGVDGFIVSGLEFSDARITYLMEQEFPFVAFGRSNPGLEFPYVDVDGAAGLRMATEHLLSLGHRKIAALAWPELSRVGTQRLEGYLTALEEAGIEPRPEWIARGEGRVGFGWVATARWLERARRNRPTAVVALNDAMAIGAMRAARDQGLRVGADLAVTGFDDAPMVQYLSPPLTSVRQPIWEIGQQVISILVGFLEDSPPADTQVLISPQLIIRESSGGESSYDLPDSMAKGGIKPRTSPTTNARARN